MSREYAFIAVVICIYFTGLWNLRDERALEVWSLSLSHCLLEVPMDVWAGPGELRELLGKLVSVHIQAFWRVLSAVSIGNPLLLLLLTCQTFPARQS